MDFAEQAARAAGEIAAGLAAVAPGDFDRLVAALSAARRIALTGAGPCDLIQPDVGWCGGLTELVRIANMAVAAGMMVMPHGSSVYSYHSVSKRENSPVSEFLMMSPEAGRIVQMHDPLLVGDPLPFCGRLKVLDAPGFGASLNPANAYACPCPRRDGMTAS